MKNEIVNIEKNVKKNGGRRPGSGRRKKEDVISEMSHYQRCLIKLDELAPKAFETLERCLDSTDDKVAIKAAETILKKYLPDKVDFKGETNSSITITVQGVKPEADE